MKKILTIGLVIGFLGILTFMQSCTKEEETETVEEEFVADNSTFAGFQTWTLVNEVNGADPTLGEMAHGGQNDSTNRKVYIKDNVKPVNGLYPKGTVVVKFTTLSNGSFEVTGLVKRGANFNTTGNGWEWFMLMPDGTIADNGNMRGANLMDGMCQGCHTAAKSKDFVFSTK